MASISTASQTGLYLYGITVAGRLPQPMGGVGGASVETIVEGSLAAVVSPTGVDRIRPQRAIWRPTTASCTTWRMSGRYCLWSSAPSVEAKKRCDAILRQNQGALLGSLERLRGRVEMGLKVYWDLPNVFEYFVASCQELEAMRDRLFRAGRLPTVEEKLELGERFAALLGQARQRHAAASRKPCPTVA